ncbi:DUF1905 domain-containing protein [Natronoflexus pectinivorans]|uniref:Bacteriocin resistance YdeI/OmpD-like protein n=1 Tax=Natronoflexus pectinivorans TaxID=682526 RepID=A0A4R2GF10_9BACT|nr:DUF1905 domain-containing protein [Natronoflexus pectinivorans]TCO06788.1 bacteriocin resistance YdeI/OmpD-like protein [Natronoflexus pectinivorans]
MASISEVSGTYLLQKFSGKGGWTYLEVPEVEPDKHAWFGEVEVSGRIDNFRFSNRKLLPMGNGRLFLPVNLKIRNEIQKEAGETVYLELQIHANDVVTPEEILDCFQYEPPNTYKNYLNLSKEEKKTYLDFILEAKSDDVKVHRIIKMMNDLSE